MIFDNKKDLDTTNVYNAIIKVIESTPPDINDVVRDGLSFLIVYRLDLNGGIDLEINGYVSSAYGLTSVLVSSVSFDRLVLPRKVFAHEQILHLDECARQLVESGSCKVPHFKLVDEMAISILKTFA